MQISTTDYNIRQCLKRMFTSVGSPSINGNSGHINNVEVNNFAVTIRDAYPNENTTYAKFVLMKGAVPTDFSGLTASTSRSSDRLVEWTVASTAGSWVEEGANSIYLQSTDLSTASQSGTATWLWWYNPYFTNYNYPTIGLSHQAVFTVGELGSGSDYELANVGIISGKGYKLVNGPRLSLATEYNY
jgi:hypothetical protein